MESKKLSARLGGYIDAIQSARAEGVTWKQLAGVFGAEPKYFHAAVKKVVKAGKHVGREQKPLPELALASSSAPAVPAPIATPKTAQTLEIPKKERAEYRTGAEIISQASNFETLK